MRFSKRMQNFKEGVFSSMREVKNARLSAGERVIDLSVGSPSVPPARHIIDALLKEAANPSNYVYAISDLPELRRACSDWYAARFGVRLDPETEITSLLGSQEGLSHIPLAFADKGEPILVPDPCYPIFGDAPRIADAEPVFMTMRRESGWLIDFRDIPTETAKAAPLMIVSYPNNPTTAIAPPGFYRELITFAREFDITVLHDNAYSDLVFDGRRVGSFLEYEGARDIGVEFNSLSKTYGLAGARVGFCMGCSDAVSAVRRLKSNMDYGIFIPVQKAAIAAITGDQACVRETCMAYEMRRNAICDGLCSIGWSVERSPATMFVWARIPERFDSSLQFVMELAEKAGVIVTPGDAFGPSGEGFVRMAFVQGVEELKCAVKMIKDSGIIC